MSNATPQTEVPSDDRKLFYLAMILATGITLIVATYFSQFAAGGLERTVYWAGEAILVWTVSTIVISIGLFQYVDYKKQPTDT